MLHFLGAEHPAHLIDVINLFGAHVTKCKGTDGGSLELRG